MTSAGPGEGKSLVRQQPGDRAGPGRAARPADRRRHAPAARARDLRRSAGAGAVERPRRQREDQRSDPQVHRRRAVADAGRAHSAEPGGAARRRAGTPTSSRRSEPHFDWVVLDTPPVMVVADSSIVANQAIGRRLRRRRRPYQPARGARPPSSSSTRPTRTCIGSVLNRVDLVRNPYYYSAYYRKEYSRYYVSSGR